MSNMPSPPRYRDNGDDPLEDQLELRDTETPNHRVRWYRRGLQGFGGTCLRCWPSNVSSMGCDKRRRMCQWVMIAVVVLTLLGVIAGLLVV